ncbi:peptidoglycan-binding domain-containing protein [Buchananella hordeovulneris]|uniref:Peptidoglycan binding-like domain-containing protein n=2 Tax=Buchananella hordeovulneris TaxID=52770 RepID=A0A1Q5PVG5_9ACTO|nr:peptidoglycan-binding domain-containing protein [Buchananella hordeovulneris]MDO5080443.1 peptidoglycan-binding domain-containing protein [Buchananella hordeovulneris]OKL51410.1 hypothetical protein BSZ40_07535 [Buchananella hordeovulneris]
MRRRSLVIAALCLTGALLIMLGTWFAAKRFQSPDQRQAAAAPPTAGPIVVEVTRGDLTEQTTMKATASRAGERSVPLPLPGAVSVLTHPGVAADTELLSGNVIAWINDRPVFALRGPFPLFRDIGEGDSGDDVRLLQQALADLGYDITPDGHFGAYTASLVRDLYETAGAEPAIREVAPDPIPAPAAPAAPPAAAGDAPTTPVAPGGAAAPTPQPGASPAPAPRAPAPAPTPKKQVYLPAAEVVILPEMPVHVTSVPAVGTVLTAENAKLALGSRDLTLSTSVPGSIATRLREGTPGVATLGQSRLELRVASIKEADKKSEEGEELGVQGDESTVEFAPLTGGFPTEWAGKKDILITLDLTTPRKGVLQVPQRALAHDATGGANVLVRQSDNSFTQTSVTEIGCVAGLCGIEDGPLQPGDVVRVDR